MAPPARVPSQPDLSPTHSLSGSPTRTAPDPVRRNLFSAHLSRRPASSQSTTSRPSSQSQNATQPPSLPSQTRNISPFTSPPRLSPTHPLPPSFNETYDPVVSPHRSLSPRTVATLFPSSSVVALNPSTGRPILPNLPTLPARLRLSDSDDDDEEEEDDDDEEHDDTRGDAQYHDPVSGAEAYMQQRGPYGQRPPGSKQQQQHTSANPLYPDDSPSASASGSAQHDALVTDLMSRYRARRQQQGRSSTVANMRPLQAHSAERVVEENEEAEEEEERAELMAHLMGRLRREVVRVEEEGWMFGDVDVGGAGDGMGVAGGGLVSGGGAGTGVGVGVSEG
ncbi:uncharacterized protein HMPREF1541_04778 [Cyphellophora europaea CBS 101466]|uniref:Uncharacterized protein n=1 Tax=Cyphellophora europaea (strain CBS 101466) TaxID=1220924 RepID=W2RVG7_CYPE1|nr:uncharacterized protein HMPREF1541_04778 [Cyphellophora europaea CBS 101466]ETN40501.1 hypothetical protein HMPREF1541_04778 [Cyphellophora europaea CBS 101466]